MHRAKYKEAFGTEMFENDFSPKIICSVCVRNLYRPSCFKFNRPAVWRYDVLHQKCFFCLTDIAKRRHSDREIIDYASDQSTVVFPVIYEDDMDEHMEIGVEEGIHQGMDERMDEDEEVNEETDDEEIEAQEDEETDEEDGELEEEDEDSSKEDSSEEDDDEATDPSFGPTRTKKQEKSNEKVISGAKIRDLLKTLELTKEKSEVLVSFLKKEAEVEKEVKVTHTRKRNDPYKKYFAIRDDFTYCKNVPQLFLEQFKMEHKPEEWRLFVDGSVKSLKVGVFVIFLSSYPFLNS